MRCEFALWAPYKICDMRRIEKIQASFTKWIKVEGGNNLDYWQRLQKFNLYSIQRRFERYRIIYVWKILHGMVVNPGVQFNENRGSRNGISCKIPKHTIRQREESFLVKGPKLFNNLPKEIKEFPIKYPNSQEQSIDAFKGELDKFLSKIPDEPNMGGEYTKRMTGTTILGERTNSMIRIN